jgi:hypothetical protein
MTRTRKIYRKKIVISGVSVHAVCSNIIRRYSRRALIIGPLKALFCKDISEQKAVSPRTASYYDGPFTRVSMILKAQSIEIARRSRKGYKSVVK